MEYTNPMTRDEYVEVWFGLYEYLPTDDDVVFSHYIKKPTLNHTKLLSLLTKGCNARVYFKINKYKVSSGHWRLQLINTYKAVLGTTISKDCRLHHEWTTIINGCLELN